MIKTTRQKGFTLVELAIVLMIVGLLVGGVLRGQELMANSQITSTIEQVKAYQGAFHTFVEAYNNYPGDMPTATARLPNCTTQNNCQNGDGNAIIGALNPGQGSHVNEPWQEIDSAVTSENTQFWKQLALAHLITGVDPSAATPEWGRSHPISKLSSAGFFIRYTNFNVVNWPANWTGHILVLRENVSGKFCNGPSAFCSTSPQRAAQLDRKMDNGVATTGEVWGFSNNWNEGCGLSNYGPQGANGYQEGGTANVCELFFLISP